VSKVPLEIRVDAAVLAKRAYSIWVVGDFSERDEARWMLQAQYVTWDAWVEVDDGEIQNIPYYRCDGRLICWDCWRPYNSLVHLNCQHAPELTVLCNGWRVKL
jgi:hypothetical protein